MKWSAIRRKLARVDRAIDKAIEKAETPGAVVLARMPREGELLEHLSVRGLAVVRPERIPMARDTIFDLASLTKPLATATAIMLLEADGAVALDDPVSKHLPAFCDRDKDGVTLRHLLTHSSGLKPWRAFHEMLIERERKKGERLIGTAAAREMIIDRTLRSGLVHTTGDAAVYGDLDFIALGAVVEAAAHQPLDQFCDERIFQPLGLENTFFIPAVEGHDGSPLKDEVLHRVAATEECAWRERVMWGEVHDPNAFSMGGVAGHAGLFSTVDDVMKFATTALDVWHGRSDVWPRELLRTYFTRQAIPETPDWALGWDTPTVGASSSGQYFSRLSVGHLGFTGTSVWIDLEREAVIVMLTNRIHLIEKRSHYGLRPVVHDLIREGFDAG